MAPSARFTEDFAYEVLSVVGEIPEGTVATYGQIARLIGRDKNSRLVARVLSHASDYGDFPCHRVVNHAGRLVPGSSSGLLDKYLAKGPSKSCIKATKDALSGSNNIGDYLHFKSAKHASTGSYSSYKIVGGNCFYKK